MADSATPDHLISSSHETASASPKKSGDPVFRVSVLTCVPRQDSDITNQDLSQKSNPEILSENLLFQDAPAAPSLHEEKAPLAPLVCSSLDSKSFKKMPKLSSGSSQSSVQLEAQLSIVSPQEASVSSSDTIFPTRSPKPCITGHKKCEFGNGCTVQPSFNYPGEMGGMFCGCHRLEGMVNVVNKMCEFEGCHKRPSLNYPGVRPAIRCGEHKLPGMTNSFRKLDTSILSSDLKEKAEELKKRPKKRGDMIKVQRHFIKEKIFSTVINDELSREEQEESTSPPRATQAIPKSNPSVASKSEPLTTSICPQQQQSKPNSQNISNTATAANCASYSAPFQTGNALCAPYQATSLQYQAGKMPFQGSSLPFHANSLAYSNPGTKSSLYVPDFAAYAANLNMLNGDLHRMKDFGFRGPDCRSSLYPGSNLQYNQYTNFNQFNTSFQSHLQESRPTLYSDAIPPVVGYMPLSKGSKEGAEAADLSIFANIASSLPQDPTYSFSKRRRVEMKNEIGAKGKIAELLSRTTEEKSGGAFATVAGRSFRPILGRATPMTFPKC